MTLTYYTLNKPPGHHFSPFCSTRRGPGPFWHRPQVLDVQHGALLSTVREAATGEGPNGKRWSCGKPKLSLYSWMYPGISTVLLYVSMLISRNEELSLSWGNRSYSDIFITKSMLFSQKWGYTCYSDTISIMIKSGDRNDLNHPQQLARNGRSSGPQVGLWYGSSTFEGGCLSWHLFGLQFLASKKGK